MSTVDEILAAKRSKSTPKRKTTGKGVSRKSAASARLIKR